MLTSLLDLVNNKATAAASFQNVFLATPKHHGPEGRNDLQINRKNKFPGGRNVPSEIVLEILSNPAIPSPARILLEIESNPIHPMLTSLLDLVKNKATAAAGFQNVPVATPKHHATEGCGCLPAAACCWCSCWWLLLLLWCCCGAAAIKQPPKQETNSQTPFSKHPKQQHNT